MLSYIVLISSCSLDPIQGSQFTLSYPWVLPMMYLFFLMVTESPADNPFNFLLKLPLSTPSSLAAYCMDENDNT